ncbi:hypothetical protein EMEDMD4_900009 [Sinorhizobium medicae]|uniref:Uncharacterized protein n=1 Tax=Sinorhizobium medicae TaxID=110321 RepID=A0A508X879_9HYPH|nr:hypothetical protein EMEDMD4_900009 [Sinorhizobium medicae]
MHTRSNLQSLFPHQFKIVRASSIRLCYYYLPLNWMAPVAISPDPVIVAVCKRKSTHA